MASSDTPDDQQDTPDGFADNANLRRRSADVWGWTFEGCVVGGCVGGGLRWCLFGATVNDVFLVQQFPRTGYSASCVYLYFLFTPYSCFRLLRIYISY